MNERMIMSNKMAKKRDASEEKNIEDCFVMMPISTPEGYDKGHFGHVYKNLIKPACETAQLNPIIASDVEQTNLIHLDIITRIVEAPMSICDISSKNPNVMFELGIRQAFDMPVVLIQEEGASPIFDVNILRHVEYSKTMKYHEVLDDQEKLVSAIEKTREAVDDPKSQNSIVKLLGMKAASVSKINEGDLEQVELAFLASQISSLRQELRIERVSDRSPPRRTNSPLSPSSFRHMIRSAEKIIQRLDDEPEYIATNAFENYFEELKIRNEMERNSTGANHPRSKQLGSLISEISARRNQFHHGA